jgi:N-acetylmuramic acid 6-phosphate etherase
MTPTPSSLGRLTTEAVNPASARIDELDAAAIVAVMNAEDALVAAAVARESAAIARAIDVIADRFRRGGRLVYIGAGTSGRLGVLDASECPPTFGTPPEMVVGLIAGGPQALTRAVEGAEDSRELAAADLAAIGLSAADVLVGIATSGRTPYVLGGLAHARAVGAFAIGFACNDNSELEPLKAGTATKMVLNMLTTGAMIRIGKTYGNLMVDLRATNTKLVARTRRIVTLLTGASEEEAERLVAAADGELKTAVVSRARGVSPADARRLLAEAGGHLRRAVGDAPLRSRGADDGGR